jgi:hypothetical protein
MSSNNTEKVLASIDNIKNYILRLSFSTNQAVDTILDELEKELTSHNIYKPEPDNVIAIPQYPYEYREVPYAFKILMKIRTANGMNESNATQYDDYIKELESKLIEIYYSVKLEAGNIDFKFAPGRPISGRGMLSPSAHI